MSTPNPLLAAIAPALIEVLTEIQTAASSIAANPTIENVNEQVATLAVDAVNPTHLEGVSVAGAAQEVANLAAALQAHVTAATAAPTAATVPASETGNNPLNKA